MQAYVKTGWVTRFLWGGHKKSGNFLSIPRFVFCSVKSKMRVERLFLRHTHKLTYSCSDLVVGRVEGEMAAIDNVDLR